MIIFSRSFSWLPTPQFCVLNCSNVDAHTYITVSSAVVVTPHNAQYISDAFAIISYTSNNNASTSPNTADQPSGQSHSSPRVRANSTARPPQMPPKSASVVLEDLKEKVAAVFDQAQASLASHRKNCVALYKLHVQAGNVTEVVKNGRATKLVGERAFGDAFVDMIARVLVVKKGPTTADRVVKFVGTYVKFMNEKAADEKVKQAKAGQSISAANVDDDDDTLVSRFVSRLLKWLLQGFLAKNKIVRYRSVFIVSELISHLGEIDEETYSLLRGSLVERVSDKESLIRAYAVVALSKLVGTEDPNEVQDGEKTILETLLEITCFDDAAEVRRAALLNIPLDNTTLDTFLSRTRDTDLVIRRLVYSMLQSKLSHPRQLSIAQRELIIKDGLGDREPTVRLAAGKLVASWFDKVKGEATIPDDETWEGDDGGVMRGFVAFLSLFDVVGPGESIAIDAMLSIFVTRPELADSFDFQEVYWKELTPESSVLARAFVEHYDSETRLEAAALPVVTAFAFYIQEAYNSLLDVLQEEENARLRHAAEAEEEEEAEKREEELAKKEVVLGELLRIVLKLDYMDEIGRRKVFSVVKDMLSHPELPSSLIDRCIDIMKAILPNERELIRIVVEVIIELRENDQDPHSDEENIDDSRSDASHATFRRERSLRRKKQPHEMTAEERAIADIIDLRCLIICIALLERVDGTFEDNSTLEGILADLIIPSVKRKEPALREKGLISLGLCCLIAKNMALSSFQLFLNQVQTVPEDMKMRVIQVIFDLLTMYPQEFFNRSEDIAKRITNFLLEVFQSEVSDKVLASMTVGFSKLLLAGVITDPAVLTVLALSYVNFETCENQELRQCLAYFFPVYCYSSQMNQSRVQSIFMQSFNLFVQLHEENESDETIILPYQFGQLMIDWTNSQKAAAVNGASPVRDIHADVAVDILYALYEENLSASHKKIICQLLGQLEIGVPVDDRTLFKLHLLLSHLQQQCPLNDPASDKIFGRFKDRIYKLFSGDLEKLNAVYFTDDEFSQLYQYIGIDMPNEGHEAGRGRRATRITPELESDRDEDNQKDDPESSPSPRKQRRKSAAEQGAVDDHDESPAEDQDEPISPSDLEASNASPVREEPSKVQKGKRAAAKGRRKPNSVRGQIDNEESGQIEAESPKSLGVRKGIKRSHTNGPNTRKSPTKKRSRIRKSQSSQKSSHSAKPTARRNRAQSPDNLSTGGGSDDHDH